MFKSHIITLAVCDTVTVLLGDIVLLAFEKILVLFSRHRKTAFLQLHKFLFTTAQIFFTTVQSVHNCTLKNPAVYKFCRTLPS